MKLLNEYQEKYRLKEENYKKILKNHSDEMNQLKQKDEKMHEDFISIKSSLYNLDQGDSTNLCELNIDDIVNEMKNKQNEMKNIKTRMKDIFDESQVINNL